MEALQDERKVQVFATDIDSSAIEAARTGIYPDSIAADVSAERLRRFFTKHENTYQVVKRIRDTLVFAEQDLIKDPPFSRLDLISCHNLLIYIDGDLQKKLVPLFHYALKQDGYLFLGTSESIGEITPLFGVVDRKWKIFQRRGGLLHGAEMEFPTPTLPLDVATGAGVHAKPERLPSPRQLTERMLLEGYAPACVLVSEKGEGLYFHGPAGKYLQPPSGDADWNIVGMAREGLGLDLASALRRVAAQKKAIR